MKSQNLRSLTLALAVLVLVVAGCGRFTGSPTKSFKAFYEAARTGDAAGMKKTISKAGLDAIEKEAKKENQSSDAFLIDNPMKRGDAPKDPELRNEKITGDTATIEFHITRGDKWESVPFVKEDGEWKIAFDKVMAND